MSLTHTPGDRLFVDYAGDPAFFTDPATGIEQKAWLFVAVWPYSVSPVRRGDAHAELA